MRTIETIENRDQAIASVIIGLCWLIVNHARAAACEQWAPSKDGDDSDDYIKEHSEWLERLRLVREDFENIVTGFLPRKPKAIIPNENIVTGIPRNPKPIIP